MPTTARRRVSKNAVKVFAILLFAHTNNTEGNQDDQLKSLVKKRLLHFWTFVAKLIFWQFVLLIVFYFINWFLRGEVFHPPVK